MLQAVFRNRSRQEALQTSEAPPPSSDDEHGRLIDVNLKWFIISYCGPVETREWRRIVPHHALNGIVNLSHRKLENETDGLLLAVSILLNDLIEQTLGLGPISPLLDACVTADLGILIDDSKTDNLITIINQLVNQPFEGKLRVIILVGATQEGPRASAVTVVLVLGIEGQREVGRIFVVKGIERDSRLEGTNHRLISQRLGSQWWRYMYLHHYVE